MLLGIRYITQGDTRRFVIDYSGFLPSGIKLKLPVVTVNGNTLATVGNVSLDPADLRVIFYLTAGTTNGNFTASVQVQDTNNEVVNDTIDFAVVSS